MSIFARSPYIVEINETGQIETKIQVFLWNGNTTPMPSSPAYTLSKKIPSSNAPATYYDLSPYIREFINHNTRQTITSSNASTPASQWCWVGIKKFKKISSIFIQIGTTQTIKAFDGYGYYEEGYNPDLSRVHLDEGTYYYYPDGSGDVGHLTIQNVSSDFIRYTNLVTGATTTSALGTANVQDYPRVHSSNYYDGNLVDFIDSSGSPIWSATFKPKDECKYTPVRCDFVNKYGAWQTEWFFKASNQTFNVENTEYNLMQSTYPNYSVMEGQRKVFNVNGKTQLRVNTDWVAETYSETIKQLMLSERILIDYNTPAKINTKSMELFKHINQHMINYQLEFEYAFDTINSVV